MRMGARVRKRVQHHDTAGDAREFTFSCHERRPYLTDIRICRIVLGAIRTACEAQGVRVGAFVLMPEHVHLLVLPAEGEAVVAARFLYAIKRPSSFRIRRLLEESGEPRAAEMVVRTRPGTSRFRFWQEGGAYDRNIQSQEAFRASIEYIHANPVKRGLCREPGEWAWSSWGQWHEPDTPIEEWMPRVDRSCLI